MFSNSVVCKSCISCKRAATKERRKPGYCSTSAIKICEQCFLCRSIEFSQTWAKCPNCSSRSTCMGKTTLFLENSGSLGGQSKGNKNTQRRLNPPLPDPAKSDKVTNYHKLLYQASQEPLSITSQGSICRFTSSVKPINSKLYHLVCPQHPWNLRSNLSHYKII